MRGRECPFSPSKVALYPMCPTSWELGTWSRLPRLSFLCGRGSSNRAIVSDAASQIVCWWQWSWEWSWYYMSMPGNKADVPFSFPGEQCCNCQAKCLPLCPCQHHWVSLAGGKLGRPRAGWTVTDWVLSPERVLIGTEMNSDFCRSNNSKCRLVIRQGSKCSFQTAVSRRNDSQFGSGCCFNFWCVTCRLCC